MSEFVVGGNSLFLTASEIPQAVLDARVELEKFYRSRGFKPLTLIENLLHSSIARITAGDVLAVKAFVSRVLPICEAL